MKILIFGVPGSGKTHLARKIGSELNLPLFHIDKHFFEKRWVERDHDHFLEDVRNVLKTDRWIIDGNGMRTLGMRFKEADVVIYCKFSRILCLYRIFYRWISTLGRPKEDGPEGARNSITWKLVKYLWNFEKRYEMQIAQLKREFLQVKFFEVRSNEEMEKSVRDICNSK